MMSAPSAAIRTAWARPCPRAAPVMKATFPSNRPAMCPPCGSSVQSVGASKAAAVDRVHLLASRARDDEDVHVTDRRDLLPTVTAKRLGHEAGLRPQVDRRRAVLGIPLPVR